MSGYVSGRTSITSVLTGDIAADAITSAKIDDSALNDNIFLNGTNSSSANAGSSLILDASAASTDVGSRIMYEDGSTDNDRFIDSVNETDKVALVDKVLLDGYASGAGDGDALLNETGGHLLYDEGPVAPGVISGSNIILGSEQQGDVMYYGDAAWTKLAPGTDGHFLKTQGPSAIPAWAAAGGGLASVQVYASEGAVTWTKPAGLARVVVWVCGGGGGGSGTPSGKFGGSAGGGGVSIELIAAGSCGATETVTVGAGGAGGASGGNNGGSNGGTSSFGSHCTATGGSGGQGNGNSGGPGEGAGGNFNFNGVNGGGSEYHSSTGGAQGGGSAMGFGGGGRGGKPGYDAGNGRRYGGGGGGANSDNDGGDGSYGCVLVWEYN